MHCASDMEGFYEEFDIEEEAENPAELKEAVENLKEFAKAIDTDGDGKLSKSEWRQFFRECSMECSD